MEFTVFGGTLKRLAKNKWEWADGTPRPNVFDDLSECNFRCRTYGDRQTFVEVPLGLAQETEALAWVIEGAKVGRYKQGQSGDHTGPLMITEEGAERMHIQPGEDPLLGNEPIISPGPIPAVILVPIQEWDAWANANPTGAVWAAEEEERILAKAESLGWNDPRK